MAITNFIPEVWSARLTHGLFANSAFVPNANRAWEGDASMGNKVRIFTLDPDSVSIKDYNRTADLDSPEDLDTTYQVLTIDQEKYFNFAVEDLDQVQSRAPLIDAANSNVVRRMALTIDHYTAGLFTGIPSSGSGAWGLRQSPTGRINLDFTSAIKKRAQELNLPVSGLVAITTPAVLEKVDEDLVKGTYGHITQANQISGSGATQDPTANAAFAGTLNDIRFYVSNDTNLTSGSGSTQRDLCWVYDPRDLALVVQVNKVEAYRPERRFADAVKGLTNYAGRVLNASRMMEFVLQPNATS